jgi:hypothetical protein
MWLAAAIVLVLFVLWYALRGRAWLKERKFVWSERMFELIEPVEIALYKKSETMLVGRLLWVGSAIVTLHDTIAVIAPSMDFAPITSRLLAPVPEDMRGIVTSGGVALIGLLIGWLRKRTSKPLPVVEAPESEATTIIANEKVERTNAQAVAAVEAAKE